ncbi:MAG: hypothetical protein WA647_19030 [Candidatus Acidiferrum sp.]
MDITESKPSISRTVRRASGRRCAICAHPQCTAIDLAIVQQKEIRAVARQYDVSEDAIGRHRKHIIELVARSPDALTLARADTIATEIAQLEQETANVYNDARVAKNGNLALAAIRQLQSLLEFRARITGAIKPTTAGVTNVILAGSEALNDRLERLISRARPISIDAVGETNALQAPSGE